MLATQARLVSVGVLTLHSSFDARDQVVYFKWFSEQARRTRGGGLGFEVGV
jgi:hypothetical protein